MVDFLYLFIIMIANTYKYALIDFSYILSRNLFACSKGKGINEFTPGDVMRLTIQTLNKIPRDWGITADKMIMLYDSWDRTIGGYWRAHMIKDYVSYKGSRTWMTEDKLAALKADPDTPEDVIQKAELELYTNQVKRKAKQGMVDDFGKIGIPCLGVESFEFDDLAWLATNMLFSVDDKPSVIITKDSDLQYSLSPKMHFFKLPTAGSEPQVITYESMCTTIPQPLIERGVSLYQYKAYLDSLGYGHNDMKSTKKKGSDPTETILEILDGDYSGVENVDAFKAQFASFDLSNFPRLEEAKRLVAEKFETTGHLGSLDNFHEVCKKHNISGISDKYFSGFSERFDQKLFSE